MRKGNEVDKKRQKPENSPEPPVQDWDCSWEEEAPDLRIVLIGDLDWREPIPDCATGTA